MFIAVYFWLDEVAMISFQWICRLHRSTSYGNLFQRIYKILLFLYCLVRSFSLKSFIKSGQKIKHGRTSWLHFYRCDSFLLLETRLYWDMHWASKRRDGSKDIYSPQLLRFAAVTDFHTFYKKKTREGGAMLIWSWETNNYILSADHPCIKSISKSGWSHFATLLFWNLSAMEEFSLKKNLP